ncbi:hypothetical protein HCN44_007074 [Aphidius gifuensis]|uniref:THAP-type domain-containing protein n=1 Tax=Aphidius gifuensis TaxID=684658 RepID=A0A834XNY9_APHGI|nr:hypothetical protein HCN44_007074 [Aphidius gifuensis]
MVVYCCVKNCKNDWIPNSNLTFHRFPWSNPSLLNAWVNVMPLRNNNINKSSRICSDHFTENDYENNGRIYRRLKKNAVPQIFPCYDLSNALSDSSHDNVTNNSTQNILTNLSPLCEGSQHSLTPLTNNILHEHSNDSSSAKNMETLNTDEQRTESTNNKILEEKETSYRRRIKTLQRRLQRNHQKLEKMSNVIKLLRSEVLSELNNEHNYTVPDLNQYKSFTCFVDRGGLCIPSKSIFEIAKYCEKLFRAQVDIFKNINDINFRETMCAAAITHFLPIISKLFIPAHPVVETVHDWNQLHEYKIIKFFTAAYVKIRLLHAYSKLKTLNDLGTKASMRPKLTKLVLFSNV